MKSGIISLLILIGYAGTVSAQFQQETRQVLMQGKRTIEPGNSVTAKVSFSSSHHSTTRKQLRVVGGGQMPGAFKERGETLFREMEHLIDDYLDSIHTKKDRYALYFEGNGESYERNAYYRIPGSCFNSTTFSMEIHAQAMGLKLEPDGRFGVSLEVYYPKEGRAADDIYDAPDTTLYYAVPVGDYTYRKKQCRFSLSAKPAAVLVKVGGQRFTGACRVEAPVFKVNGKKIGDFSFTKKDGRRDQANYWVGVNLLSKSWPLWSVKFNDKEVFRGHVFDRSSNVADFYVQLPEKELEKEGEITLTLLDEPGSVRVPYELTSLEMIEETADDYEIVSLPRHIALGDTVGVLIEVNKPGVKLSVRADERIRLLQQDFHFQKKGLHVVRFLPLSVGADIPLHFSDGVRSKTVAIPHVLRHGGQRVYISSGDEVYIDKVPASYDYFFKWYFKARVGNWYQFRPSYQWSGFRQVNDSVMSTYFNLLNQMHVPFAWQVEGRTLAAKEINPSLSLLRSPMFRGKQAHENDGGYYYWGHFLDEGLFTDIRARHLPYGGIFAKHRPIYTPYGKFVHYDPCAVKDMADGAELLVRNLAYSRGESTRHTGPSTMFRYFFQAGYQWVGAEQMYGPEEVILSALRGASRAYGKQDYGSLHAMQWGSSPFTAPEHALRLYLSLATAYMHGSSHLNTEEALWTDEYANDRYSVSGKQHLYAQTQMLDYIETHSRQGELKSNIAILQGRNCSWKCFGRTSMWSQKDEKWKFGKINESFDLLNLFYPDNVLDWCGPEGWFTSTPYGAVDILPIEADDRALQRYNALVFLGWNTYQADDFGRLLRFVEQGGTVLLSAAHLNANLQPDEAPAFPEDDRVIRQLLGDDYRLLQSKTEIRKGKGRVIYYPQALYPSEIDIRADYEKSLRELAEIEALKESVRGSVYTKQRVSFTVWDTASKRTIYLLNTDWASAQQAQQATLVLGDRQFEIDVRRYQMETIHMAAQLAVLPLSNTTDVLSIEEVEGGWAVHVQATEKDVLKCFNGHSGEIKECAIESSGTSTFFIKK